MSLEDFEEIVANVEISATLQVLKDGIMADRNFDISPILNTKISLKANQRLSDEDEEFLFNVDLCYKELKNSYLSELKESWIV